MTKTQLLLTLDELLNKEARGIDEQDLESARRIVLDELSHEANTQLGEGMRLSTYIKKAYKAKTIKMPWNR